MLSYDIFKAYDIRGIVPTTLNAETAYMIGRGLGTWAHERNISKVAIGRDGRLSGLELQKSLMKGIMDSGVGVLNVGMVTTPMLYFAAFSYCNGSGIMVTGSHNPPNYNGFKMMLGGITLAGETIQRLFATIAQGKFSRPSREGLLDELDISSNYIQYVLCSVKPKRKIRVAVDCGNGIAGLYAPKLFRELGCDVVELFCKVDGNFPNHHPDPSKPENLRDLIREVQQNDCELGFAFDGDGNRLGVVTKDGNIIWPDRQLMLFAQDVLSRNEGASIIYDVKSTRNLDRWIKEHGGEPVLCRTGHSFIKQKMRETGALLAGEMSGHVFFRERWFGFDDGIYAGARMLEILSAHSDATEVLNSLPDSISTPEINIQMRLEGDNHKLIDELKEKATFASAQRVIDIDGLRVEYADGFGLVRASNTTPVLVLRFEADSEEALEKIKEEFRQVFRTYTDIKPNF